MKRRKLFERSALAVAAGAVTGATLPTAATAAPRRSTTRTGTVTAVHGTDLVEVAFADGSPTATVRTDGFPDGWKLRVGDQVVVTDFITGEFVAAPLVIRATGALHGAAGPGIVRVADTTCTVRSATVRTAADTDAAYEAYLIENAHGLRPDCVALRPTAQPS